MDPERETAADETSAPDTDDGPASFSARLLLDGRGAMGRKLWELG